MKRAGRLYLVLIARFTPVRLLCNPMRCNWRIGLYADIVPLGILTQSASLLMSRINSCAHFTAGENMESQGLEMPPNI